MKKIPTLFERVFEEHRLVDVLPNVTQGFEWVLDGKGIATVKIDGSCCAIINGELYKRYDAKHGKPIPDKAIKCQEYPDPVTGHMPCWVKCNRDNPADKWFFAAYDSECTLERIDGTYEAVGKHFNGNPYNLDYDKLVRHGISVIDSEIERTFDGIKKWLSEHNEEGIVFWLDGEPKCKIKRSDFGLKWG